jgi:hypothetical protein
MEARMREATRYTFGPQDDAAYYRARDDLEAGFASWIADTGIETDPACLISFLDYKWGYGDGKLVRWTTDQMQDMLLDWFPRKVSMPADDIPEVVPETRAFVRFLDERGFIRVEIFRIDDLEKYQSESAIRAAGRLRTEGKSYIMRDGDVAHFLFNV